MEIDQNGPGRWEMGKQGKRTVLEEFEMFGYYREIIMKIFMDGKKGHFSY